MDWKTLRRFLAIVLVPAGILAGSIALCLGAVYAASLLDVPASQLKALMFLVFFIALICFAKIGGWILSTSAEVAPSSPSKPAVTLHQRLWRFGENAHGWIAALVSSLLAPAFTLIVISAADRRGLPTWALVALCVPAWIVGIAFARRFMVLLGRAMRPLQPTGKA